MIAKGMCAALAAFGFGIAVAAGPLDELMPVPRQVAERAGVVLGKSLGDVRFVSGSVEGAPAAVAASRFVHGCNDIGGDLLHELADHLLKLGGLLG